MTGISILEVDRTCNKCHNELSCFTLCLKDINISVNEYVLYYVNHVKVTLFYHYIRAMLIVNSIYLSWSVGCAKSASVMHEYSLLIGYCTNFSHICSHTFYTFFPSKTFCVCGGGGMCMCVRCVALSQM